MTFRFDARALVGPPYWRCPRCGKDEFGVYHIGANSYSRRCRACWQKGEYPLWPLARKVIYIDQWAISNMMMALNAAVEAHTRAAANPFWLELFEALERVCKLQLVICPYSQVHRHESMLSQFFEPLKRMYEQLSHGVRFDDPEQIAQRQLNTALLAWLRNETPTYDFDPQRVTNGGLNEWKERFIISVSSAEYPPDLIAGIRQFRDRVAAGVRDVFAFYQSNPNKDFAYWLEHERAHSKRGILGSAEEYIRRMRDMAARGDFSLDNVYSSSGLDHFNLIVDVLRANVPATDVTTRLRAFLDSDTFKDYPVNQIGSLLWAGIARNASHGQKRPPNDGMTNDITAVATFLPFCDAMLIDNECRGLWESIPKQFRLAFSTPVFSYNTRHHFLAYLREIERNADRAILGCVQNVYGDPTPFLTMYDERRRDGQPEDSSE